MCEFEAKEEDLCGPVRPQKKDHKRSSCSVTRAYRCFAQIKTERELADDEKQCGERGARKYVAPGCFGDGNASKQDRKQHCENGRRYEELNRLPQWYASKEMMRGVLAGDRDRGVGSDDHKKQRTDTEDHRDSANAVDHAGAFSLRHFPDRIQCVFDLAVDAQQTKSERHQTESSGDEPDARPRGAADHLLEGAFGCWTEGAGDLMKDDTFRRLSSENYARTGDGDHRDRSDGQRDVKRESGAEARSVISSEVGERLRELTEVHSQRREELLPTRSEVLGGPLTQLRSQAPSTVMKRSAPSSAVVQA